MEDRLAEFRLVAKGKGPPVQIKNVNSSLMPDFALKIKLLQQSINQIRANNKEIQNIKEQNIAAILSEQERKLTLQMNHYTEQNKALYLQVKGELEALQKEVNASKIAQPNEPETRIKTIGYQSFATKFAETLKEFQNVQIEYKDAMKNKISRQAKIIDPTLTEEQILSIVNDPEGSQRLFSQQQLGKTHAKVQGALSDIQDKYNDIRKLEQGVQAIHEMFLQLALLVQTQNVTIDSIDQNLGHAQNYVKSANSRLLNARRDHEQASKWKLIVMMIILIFGALLMYFIFFK